MIVFRRCPFGSSLEGTREIALLGENVIGSVMTYAGGRRVTAIWRCSLFEDGRMPRPATTLAAARRQLVMRVAEWFDLCGPRFGNLARDVRSQLDSLPKVDGEPE